MYVLILNIDLFKQHELSFFLNNSLKHNFSFFIPLFKKKKEFHFFVATEQGLVKGWGWHGETLLSPLQSKVPNLALFCVALGKAGFSEETKHQLPLHFTLLFNY